jgi:hypothetical protein
VEVPGIDHNVTRPRVLYQDADVVMIGLWLRERVIQDDVHRVIDGLVGVDLDDGAVLVGVKHVG